MTLPKYIVEEYEHYNEKVKRLHAAIKALLIDDEGLPACVHALEQALTRRDIYKRKLSAGEYIWEFSIRHYLPSPEFPGNVNYVGKIFLDITYNSSEQPRYEINTETLNIFMPYLKYQGQDWDSLAGYYRCYTLNELGWNLTKVQP